MKVLLVVVSLVISGGYAAPTAWDCKHDDVALCLGLRAVAFMQRLDRMDTIHLIDGVSFVGSGEVDRSGRALSEAELENSLPEDVSQKSSRLFDMFVDAAVRFFKTHTLQFKLPESTSSDLKRAFDEGRGKLKKSILPIVIGVAAKIFAVIPLLLGGLALIATKALVIAKIAFVIVAVIAAQKFLGGGGGGFGKVSSSSGWNSGNSYSNTGGWNTGSSGGPYSRNFDEKDAQNLAYGSPTKST